MRNPWHVNITSEGGCGAHLQNGHRNAGEGQEQQTNPVTDGTSREVLNGVSFGLARELVAIPGYDEEVLYVFTDNLAVVAPKRRHRVEEKRERF